MPVSLRPRPPGSSVTEAGAGRWSGPPGPGPPSSRASSLRSLRPQAGAGAGAPEKGQKRERVQESMGGALWWRSGPGPPGEGDRAGQEGYWPPHSQC